MNVAETAARLKARKFFPTPEQAARIESAHQTLDWLWSLPYHALGQFMSNAPHVDVHIVTQQAK